MKPDQFIGFSQIDLKWNWLNQVRFLPGTTRSTMFPFYVQEIALDDTLKDHPKLAAQLAICMDHFQRWGRENAIEIKDMDFYTFGSIVNNKRQLTFYFLTSKD